VEPRLIPVHRVQDDLQHTEMLNQLSLRSVAASDGEYNVDPYR
jgi:hypothetical protein